MKIIAVCGMGIGTSILLKMNTEKALEALGIEGEVEAADIGTAKGAAAMADLVLTSAELAGELEDLSTPVRIVTNFMDVDEISEQISSLGE
ncbi:PTS system, ascorbate-specific IIB component [Austwickia chelonae]|uniref:Putative phosphotransferase system enzyme IIB component n=1 Tax=Austwickia chelonae NBRC 105200 TaxID=1184607 RepID=K6VJM9_9MICO|nr:PTS sugar transporter subunit IIB [Austwickia chelonae]GAB76939.1 putative phosphotransferase system enzyme IIB component [Austwickia chelonae NBRC 105200]SEW32561.1 PTS system, ascorbate-specific IIB component [Austwickia chelonae]